MVIIGTCPMISLMKTLKQEDEKVTDYIYLYKR